jgi:motility quorum-sensing regulator / GCU-specific mRNA interferase toxin
MYKSTPHYNLTEVKAIVSRLGKQSFTRTALFNSLAMGLSGDEAVGVILTLTRGMFYKSMTTITDHTLWQDVYHASCPNGKIAYIKVTLQDGSVVIQFKEK